MSQQKIDILERALKRQKTARKQAEKILEDKSLELFNTSQQLKEANFQLEGLVDEKNSQLKGVFENINDAYLVMDIKGNVLKMNDVAENFFEFTLEEENVDFVCTGEGPYTLFKLTNALKEEEMAEIRTWYESPCESEYAWFVPSEDIRSKDFSFDFRNPRKEQQELKDPEHLQQALSSYLSRIENSNANFQSESHTIRNRCREEMIKQFMAPGYILFKNFHISIYIWSCSSWKNIF